MSSDLFAAEIKRLSNVENDLLQPYSPGNELRSSQRHVLAVPFRFWWCKSDGGT